MKPRECIISAIEHREVRPVPFTFSIEDAALSTQVEKALGEGWYGRLPEYMVGCFAVDTNRQYRVDEARVKDAYGATWRTDRRPWHLEEVPLKEPSLYGYDFPKPEDFFNPEWRDQSIRTCQDRSDYFLLGHLGWGLFERAWNLRGFENVLMDFIAEEAFIEEVLDRLTELYLAFVEYTAVLPIDGILFGDDWGDQRGVIIGPDRWRKFLKPRWAKIYDAVHSHGMFVMTHSCGSVRSIIPDLIDMGLDVLESVQPEAAGMYPYELKKEFGRDLTFWGCLGSQSTLPFGSPEDVRNEVKRLCAEMGTDGGYILAPAKPFQPETPLENVLAFIDAVQNQ